MDVPIVAGGVLFIIAAVGSQSKESCVGSGAQSKFLRGAEKDLEIDFIILAQPNKSET